MSRKKSNKKIRQKENVKKDIRVCKSERPATGQNSGNRKFDVFRFPIILWDYRWQRPQHFCVKFAEDGHRVFYFSLDTIPINKENVEYAEIADRIAIIPLRPNVWSVKICSFQTLNAYRSTITHPLDLQYLKWSIQAVKERFQIRQQLSILDLAFWYPLMSQIDNNQLIYDCMDDHSGFSNIIPELLEMESELMKNADAVITSSQLLYEKVQKANPNTLLLRNAAQFEHFSQAPEQLADEIQRLSKPVIGYIGAIADWFDVKLINELVRRNKNWTFLLVGHHYEELTDPFAAAENLILVGEKPYHELPKYLHGFDVCLIPFQNTPLTNATNPVKAYEYLSAGKPVVSVRLPETELIKDYIGIVESVEEFEQAIRKALKENREDKIIQRQTFALQNTWDVRYADLQKIIYERIFPKVSIIVLTHNNWEYAGLLCGKRTRRLECGMVERIL